MKLLVVKTLNERLGIYVEEKLNFKELETERDKLYISKDNPKL